MHSKYDINIKPCLPQFGSVGPELVLQASLFFYEGARAEGGGKKSLACETRPEPVLVLTFKTSFGMLHMVLKRRWLKSLPGADLLSRVSKDLTLGLCGLGYFRYAASAINSQGWLGGEDLYLQDLSVLNSKPCYLNVYTSDHSFIAERY